MISVVVFGVKVEEVSVIDSKKGVILKGVDEVYFSSFFFYEKEVEM